MYVMSSNVHCCWVAILSVADTER